MTEDSVTLWEAEEQETEEVDEKRHGKGSPQKLEFDISRFLLQVSECEKEDQETIIKNQLERIAQGLESIAQIMRSRRDKNDGGIG